MSKLDSNEQTDADIFQSKADVLRARDIIPGTPGSSKGHFGTSPPSGKKAHQKPRPQNDSEITTQSADAAPISVKRKESESNVASKTNLKEKESAIAYQQKSEIPAFDLANDIMAEQRKVTAVKRKAPGNKTEAQSQKLEVESTSYSIEQTATVLSEQDKIIAEIVAKDIKRLFGGG